MIKFVNHIPTEVYQLKIFALSLINVPFKMVFLLQVLIEFLTLISIFHYTRSDCLKSVSFNYWNIYSPSIRSYTVLISNLSDTEISKGQKLLLTCTSRLCYSENIEVSDQQDEEIVQRKDIQRVLISSLNIYNTEKIQIYTKDFQMEYYKTLWNKAEFLKGYYYEKEKFLLHEWQTKRNSLSLIYGAYAEESTLDVNTSFRYVTFRNKNVDYIFQLRVNITKNFWLTDRGLLLLRKTNDSIIRNSSIDLSIEIFPKNELKKCNEMSQSFLIYIYVGIGVCLLGVIITLMYILGKCIRSQFKKINTTFIQIHRFRKRESSYVRFTEVNKYAVPDSNEQKAYDKVGKRVKLPNLEPTNSGHPRELSKKKSTDLS
ncbi:uncharacterized protein [Diabrotica undecimpunctata]|uniref:uncharacterized protein n=1 Tax=Diabrotica undecimpunctata TaxID=50387 RepID=UPI003B636BC7